MSDPYPLRCPCGFEPPTDGGPSPGVSHPETMRDILPFGRRLEILTAHLYEHWARGEKVGP